MNCNDDFGTVFFNSSSELYIVDWHSELLYQVMKFINPVTESMDQYYPNLLYTDIDAAYSVAESEILLIAGNGEILYSLAR